MYAEKVSRYTELKVSELGRSYVGLERELTGISRATAPTTVGVVSVYSM